MKISLPISSIKKGVAVYRYTPESADEILVEGCLQQDRLAQKYLYQRYFGKMLGICMRYAGSRDEAEEILNTGFFKVFKSINNFKGSGSLAGWIAKVILYTAIDYARSQATYKKRMNFNTVKEGSTSNDGLQNLAVEAIFQTIQQLPVATRTVFSMYAIEGFTHKEIAKKLNISQGTSKWHLSEARKKLKHLLSTENERYHGKR